MSTRSMRRRLVFTSALLLSALTGTLVLAQDLLRLSNNVAGDSKPITLYADEVSTWSEKGQRIVILKGKILAEHGLVSVRADRAVAWIDEDAYRKTHILSAKVYAEENIGVESGGQMLHPPKLLIDLTTRGELKMKAQQGKIAQMSQGTDPLYLRALAARGSPPESKGSVRTGPVPAAPENGVQRTGFQDNPGSPPVPPEAPSPLAGPGGARAPVPPPAPVAPTASPAPSWPGEATTPISATPTAPVPFQPNTPPVTPPTTSLAPPMPPLPSGAPVAPPAGAALGGAGALVVPTQGAVPPPPPGSPPVNPTLLPPTPSIAPLPTGPASQLPPGAVPLPPRTGAPPGPQGLLVPRATPDGPPRIITIAPRTSQPWDQQTVNLPNGEQANVITGGIILTVKNLQSIGVVDIEADRVVFWSRGDSQGMLNNMRSSQGQASKEMEFYLSGNVEIRQQTISGLKTPPPTAASPTQAATRPTPTVNAPGTVTETHTLRADEVYYDVARNVAVAVRADLEINRTGVPDPVHVVSDELYQLSPTMYEAVKAHIFSSKLPSDPGLKVYMAQATIEEQKRVRRSIFGSPFVNRETGQPEVATEHLFRGTDVKFISESPFGGEFPFFWFPYVQGTIEEPFGPLTSASAGFNNIFGFQAGLTFNVYSLLGIDPIPNTKWRTDIDYLSKRGPAMGTEYEYTLKDVFGTPGTHVGDVKLYGIYDTGEDILGGDRDNQPHPDWRGRVLWRDYWTGLGNGFSVKTQGAAQSDQNFLEQYYKDEFDREINEDPWVYIKQQQGNWAWTGDVDLRARTWMTQTTWTPRVSGYLLGESFFDRFTYNVQGSMGYAQLHTAKEGPPPVEATQVGDDTGRFDVRQELSLPFYVGPVKVVPYGVLDLTEYTQDLNGDNRGRFYAAGGGRFSIPFTRIYPGVQSELFNLNGINHKIVASADYFLAHSDTPYTQLPQLDMLNDDVTDQALRNITPQQVTINAQHGLALANDPIFNAQTYALRTLVDNRIDTLDTIEELNVDIRERLQTKRGYPGMQHIVDWMTLDVSGTYFPKEARDNFGEAFNFLAWDYVWNVGDRTAIVADGWVDPQSNGPRVYNYGMYLNRPDRTSFFIGYRQIYPVNSQAVTAAVSYIFSPKYAITGSSTYDFGTSQALSNSLVLTRMGSDLQVSLGVTYNALQNNFGMTFMVVPNLLPSSIRGPSAGLLGGGGLGR